MTTASQPARRPLFVAALGRLGVLLAAAALAAEITGAVHPRAPALPSRLPGEISLETALRLPAENRLWVDARPRDAYTKGHIPGAVLLNEEEWEQLLPDFVAQWKTEQQVIVYCSTAQCQASASVAKRLREELGLTDVRVLHGGWEAWSAHRP